MGRSRTRKSRVGASAAGIALVSAALLAIAVLKARETPVGARAPTGERAVEIAAPAPVARECPAVSLSSGASEARPARSPAIGPLAREHDETGPKAASPSTVDEIAALLERADSPGFAAALEKLKLSLADAKPALVRELLERFGKTDDPLLLSAIAEALDPSGLARSEVRSALLTFAESDPSVARRVAAIAALGHAVPDDGTTERLARLASSDRTGEVRAQAAQALGDVLARDLDRAPALNGKLLEIASRDDDSSVRYAAISSLRPHEADASQVAALAETFTKESDLAPRQAAAEQLGDVPAREGETAIRALLSGLSRDTDPHVRKCELTAIVHAGRARAIPVLEKLAASTPDLARDAEDYLSELRKGEVDMDRLWAAKLRREDARRAAGILSPTDEHHDD